MSIRQPWAWLIVNGHKDIENRSWMTKYRGPVLIHAGLAMTDRGGDFHGIRVPLSELQFGGIVGVAYLEHVFPPGSKQGQWHEPGRFGWALIDAHPLPFTPMKGRLGLFDVNLEEYEQLRAALKEAGYSG